jgi:hypothetical protein
MQERRWRGVDFRLTFETDMLAEEENFGGSARAI